MIQNKEIELVGIWEWESLTTVYFKELNSKCILFMKKQLMQNLASKLNLCANGKYLESSNKFHISSFSVEIIVDNFIEKWQEC